MVSVDWLRLIENLFTLFIILITYSILISETGILWAGV